MKPENGIFEKLWQIFKEYSIRINEIETGMKQFVSELKRTEKGKKKVHMGPT